MIMAYLKNARRGGSAEDFLHDIDLMGLLPNISQSQKNNSTNVFFELRDDAFEVVSGTIKDLFASGKVTEMAITLDKVTLHSRTFTVLLTFFFYEWSIYCLLNGLLKMSSAEYDSSGTASLIMTSLSETLGLSRTRLAHILLHCRFSHLHFNFNFNLIQLQVRTAGGGCLDLAGNLA